MMAGVVYDLRTRQTCPVGVIDRLARRERTEHAETGLPGRPRRVAGRALVLLGLLGGTGLGLSAFYLDLLVVNDSFGVEGLTLSLLLPPLSFLSVPWYALFNGDPAPLALGYAAPLAGWLIAAFGRGLVGDGSGAQHRTGAGEADCPTAKVIAFRPRTATALSSRRGRRGVRAKAPHRPEPVSSHHGQTSA